MTKDIVYTLNIHIAEGLREYFLCSLNLSGLNMPPTKDILRQVVEAVGNSGPFQANVHRMLGYAYAANVYIQPGTVGAELGVDKGDGLSLWLCRDPKKVYGVDPWLSWDGDDWYSQQQEEMDKRYEDVVKRFKGDDRVEIVRAKSADWLSTVDDNFLDWCVVDGDHTEDGAYADIVGAHRCVKHGGFILVDDTYCRQWMDQIRAAVVRAEEDGYAFKSLYTMTDPMVLEVVKDGTDITG